MARRPRNRFADGPSHFEQWEGLKSDYAASKPSRFKRQRTGNLPYGSNADWHTRVDIDYYTIMEQARDMDRNDVIVGQLVTRAVVNTLQEGFSPDPQTGDKKLDRDLRARWDEWANDPDACDIRGEQTFAQLEFLAMRETLVDGDILCLLLREGQLQLVEAHRLRKPLSTKKNVVHGVLLDENRRPLEYWLTKENINPLEAVNLVSDIKPYPARDADGRKIVCHVYDPTRVTQTRGFSALTPVVDAAGMFEDINFAKMVQQQVLSCFTILRERSAEFRGGDPAAGGEQSNDPLADGTNRLIEGLAPGMQVFGQPGEILKPFNPQIPNAEFIPHVRMILTLVSINLGLPLIVALLDASETNFSGFRGAIDQARMGFRRNQSWLCDRFHVPVYQWKVRQWLAEDAGLRRAAAKGEINLLRHTWHRPAWPYLEPVKDATADLIRQRNALISPRRLQAERGRDWPTVAREIIDDNALAIVRAKQIAAKVNQKFPDDDPVHWRELISLPTPEGTKVSIAADSGAGYGSSADDDAENGGDAGKPAKRKEPEAAYV